ncbi:Serine/threonine-protein kinase RIO1 [Rhynchospora pubera]|uniref:Serine/threonine-protein kinase RIO1 n=1 Tax=Rhynchospora pubera TaxID=906938 RepID=A0AAV8F6I4_9POAL|nr:Serine/threonine-protein kinase RIO1 [Rhynchospora pubera]
METLQVQPLSNQSQRCTSHNRADADPLEELEEPMNVGMSNLAKTGIRKSIKVTAIGKTKKTDKADRATVEQTIDNRTRQILLKMINKGVFDEINGCVATGKDANVYHATKSDGKEELAIKVYKTSVLVFKNRDRYVRGDRRFSRGYCKRNPRKMVKTWAEKERRNLERVKASGIRCPKPLLLKSNVLVMEFIGKGGCAAPRLKDANLPEEKLRESYVEIITAMRTFYQECKLVHGDLSEYNILYFHGHIYIIDVSQSVHLDHQLALKFLNEDCLHVTDFFKKHGVAAMSVKELFDFVIDPKISDESVDEYLEKVQQKILEREYVAAKDDTIFPTAMYDKPFQGYVHTREKTREDRQVEREEITNQPEEIDGESSGDELCANSDEEEKGEKREKVRPEERKTARKENKKKVKEEKREARITKVPKAEKKRRKKLAKPKCRR